MLRVADYFADSDTGRARRANEDAFYAHAPVFAVADGMGGAQAGEVASRTVVDRLRRGLPDGGSPEERLALLAEEANDLIHRKAAEDEQRAGMGTTLTAAYVDEDAVSFGHVGDSRAYLFRDDKLQQLTNDHSLVGEMVRRGKLTAEQAEEHPQRSIITRALGPEPVVEVDHMTTFARDGDLFLLCSDGLTSMIGDDAIEAILRAGPDLATAGHALIDAANDGGRARQHHGDPVPGRGRRRSRPDRPGHGRGRGRAAGRGRARRRGGGRRAGATATATVAPPEAATEPTARAPKQPLPPGATAPPQRRRRRRLPFVLVAVVAVVAVLLVAGYLASRAVFFVGTDSHGVVTIYQGLPYELPFGLKLYQRYYSSGVVAAQVPNSRRRTLLDNELRSRSDATDLVRQLETGQLR